ncbi:unnamed protein product [Meganyctiphanes norvegica]|uniref:C2H2-type domain-containing protein n=1 Tax=Meganyctiphanes norvegica TaxID=48144 RepID=A0AAV2R8K8_MEGNR
MLFKGNSSKLELLIEKIQANKEGGSEEAGSLANEEVRVGVGSSWDVGSDGRGGSLSPASSRATPTSAGEVTDVEAAATLGVTSQTPYQCAFCDRAFPRLSYLKRHEQLSCSLSAKQTHKGDASCSSSLSMALNNNNDVAAYSTTSKPEFKKDYTDTSIKSNVAVIWCTKPTLLFSERSFPQNSSKKVACPKSENVVLANAVNVCNSSVIPLPPPLEVKAREKKLYCYTSAGLVSKPAVFSASLSTNCTTRNSNANQFEAKQYSKDSAKVGGMQCIVSSMTGSSMKKSEGKRKVSDFEVTEAVERVLKHKKDLMAKNSYKDNGNKYRKVEVCFPNNNKRKVNENGPPLIWEVTSGNVKCEKDSASVKADLPTQLPIQSIVSLNTDSSKSKPPKARPCASSKNQNVKDINNKKVSVEVSMPQIFVPLASTFSEVSLQIPKVITTKDVINNTNESCNSDENNAYKISPNISVMQTSNVINNNLCSSSVQTHKFASALQNTQDDNSNAKPPIPNISISLVSMKAVSMPVEADTVEGTSPNVKGIPSCQVSKDVNTLSKTTVTVASPVLVSVNTVKNSINTEEKVIEEDDGVNGQGNVWVEEKMYSFVKEELRQLGDPVPGDGVSVNTKEPKHQLKSKNTKDIGLVDKDDPKAKDASASTDNPGEKITEDVFSYIENELMRLDAMDDDDYDKTGPLNASSGDLSSTTTLDSSVNDSGFFPSGMRTPNSSQHSRTMSISSSVLSTDETWSLLSSKGSMDLHNITASSDNFLDLPLNDARPHGRRSTFSEFNRPNKFIKPRLRRFSISDSHGNLNLERSPGAESLLCLKDLDSLKTDESNNSKVKDNQKGENFDPIENMDGDESYKIAEVKSKISDTDALELPLLEKCKDDGHKINLVSNNISDKVDTEILTPLKYYKPNTISKLFENRKDDNNSIGKEMPDIFAKKRSMTQIDTKDEVEFSPKKSKKIEDKEEFIQRESIKTENVEKKTQTNGNHLQSDDIKSFTLSAKTEFIQEECAALDMKEHLLLEKEMITEEIGIMNFGSTVNNADINSTDGAKKTLNVQIPLTHVQLSKRHYDIMSPCSPTLSYPETVIENLAVNMYGHDHILSPILRKIDPSYYQYTPPCANKQKQEFSPVISPISITSLPNDPSDLPESSSLFHIIRLRTPVSTNATSATNASADYVFVTPPSFQSSSSSTLTMEETPSPPTSMGSDSPYEKQSVPYHKMQPDYQLTKSNNVSESFSTECSSNNNAQTNYLNKSYGEYLNSYLKYLHPESLNDKTYSLPSLYNTGTSSILSNLPNLPNLMGETVEEKSKCQNTEGDSLSRFPNSDQQCKNFISKLGVFKSKNEKDMITTSIDMHNTFEWGKKHDINSSVNIGHHSDFQFDEMEFPKRLKEFKCTKISPSRKNNEAQESNVINKFTEMQHIKKTDYDMPKDEICSRVDDENLEEENDMGTRLPSVHIQVRTGALAEQRGKSRAILSKLSQPLIHVGHKRHCKVEPKVILIRTGLNSPDSPPTDNETGNADGFSDRMFDDSNDRKFSAEKLLYKFNSPTNQYMGNDFTYANKHDFNNLVFPKIENYDKTTISNFTSNTDLPNKLVTNDNKISIGMNKKEVSVTDKTKSNFDQGFNYTDNEKDDGLNENHSTLINNSDLNFIDKNEWKDSGKNIFTNKSSKKNNKSLGKELLKKCSEEILVKSNLEVEQENNIFKDDKAEEFSGITNMTSFKEVKVSLKEIDVNKSTDYISGIKIDFCPSTIWKEGEKENSKPSISTRKDTGALAPDLWNAVHNDAGSSVNNYKESKNMFVKIESVKKTGKTVEAISHETSDCENWTFPKGKLKNKGQSSFNFDYSNKSLSPPASIVNTINIDSIKNDSDPLINENHYSKDMWEQNVGNVKCITKVIEGTAKVRAAIRKKKNHAAKVKRNNIAKGRRKKADKVGKKKSAYISKRAKSKSSLKDVSKNKFISYSRDGEIFDPNNLSTASGDALMAGITVHCTPEGVTLKLNCVENMDSDTSNSGTLGLKLNKSSRALGSKKSKDNFAVISPNKKKNKYKDRYPKSTTASNQVSTIDCLEMPQSSLVPKIPLSSPVLSSTEVINESSKDTFSMHVESIDSYEETGNAITESVNPCKSVLELFEDFESLLGSMEDEGDLETTSTSNRASHYPVSQQTAQAGVENTITLNGSSSFSTVVDCNNSVAVNNLPSTAMTICNTNAETNLQLVQMPLDKCKDNTALSAASRPLEMKDKIDKAGVVSNTHKQNKKYEFDVDESIKKNINNNSESSKKKELIRSQFVPSKQKTKYLENINFENKRNIQERKFPSNKAGLLSDKYKSQNGMSFTSKEIQINYKIPNMTKECTFSLNKNENYTNMNHSYNIKKSKRKNLFENKACQSNSNENYVYSKNSNSQRYKDCMNKSKFNEDIDFHKKNRDSSKDYDSMNDKNNNEFKHDHTYNSRRVKNKGKRKDYKVNCDSKTYSVTQTSNMNYTKEFFNPKPSLNPRYKIKSPRKNLCESTSSIDHLNISNKTVTEREMHTKESICTVYKENNIIAVSKTSIMLNKNTKGKSNVPFEHETETSVKNTTCTDDSSINLENLNAEKIKAKVQDQKNDLDRIGYPRSIENIISNNFSSASIEKTFHSQNTVSLTDNETEKSTKSTKKTSELESEKSYFEKKRNSSNVADENLCNKLVNEKEDNDLASPKQDSISYADTNENPQSSPDSPHFGLIHKLAQTSASPGYTKIVVKKVRSSSIDKMKNQGLLSSTLKRNVATRTELSGSQLKVKKDINTRKEFSNVGKEKILSTKINKIGSFSNDTDPNSDNSKSIIVKCDPNIINDKESLGINSSEEQIETTFKEYCEKTADDEININHDNGMTPLENLEAMADKHLPKTIEYTEFEQKNVNVKDLNDFNTFMSSESSSDNSINDIISRERNFGYSDINETNAPDVHACISPPEQKFYVRESHNFNSFSSNVVEHNDSNGLNQAQSNSRMIGNLQPLDLRLEKGEVPCAPNGTRLTGFSYSVDLNSGVVNVISTEGPEYTRTISTTEVLGGNGEINPTNVSATPSSISPVYAVQTVDNYSAALVNDGPLIMPVYSVCESKALTSSSQVMQIYSYSAEDFAIKNYDSKSIYANASAISSVTSQDISITSTGGSDDSSLVVPVYSIASTNNYNICNSDRLTENSAILEASQTLPVYFLNSFDSSNTLPCTQISTVYTSNLLDESINNFPSDPVYGSQLIPIYSVENGNNMSNTAIGIRPLNSTSENEGNIGNLQHLEVSDLSVKNSSVGDIVVNVEYVESVTESLKQENLENDTDISVNNYPENFDHYVQKGVTGVCTSITSDSEHNDVENIGDSTVFDYLKSFTEIGNLDHPESNTEITNMEYSENILDTGNVDFGDNIKSEPEDDEFSNSDTGGSHVGSEGGMCMDFLLLDSVTHADQLPFRCEFCGRLFKHKRSRDRHVKLHTGDKKYKCCHCEAAFSRSDHLKIHMKTHDTQKPYQCSVCNRGYNTAAALTAHMQNHKAKLTAHALNQLLKDAQESPDANTLSALLKDSSQNPADAAALSQLLKEASNAPPSEGGHPLGHLLLRESSTDHHTLNHFLKEPPKEQLDSLRAVERGTAASPGGASPSPGRENGSPASSPITAVPCPICHVTCRNHTHLQRHMSRHHSEDSGDRPASRGGSGTSGVSSTPSTPSPRPPSSLPSPRPPFPNPFMFLVGGKLSCIYCSRDGFLSLEALQMHIQSQHSSLLNGDSRDMANVLNLPSPLGSSLSAGGLNLNTLSPLAPSSSRGVTCELCGARVSGVTALQRHVVTAHTFTDLLARAAEGVFCAQCLLPFSNPGALAEHIKLVHASPVLSAVLNKRPPSPPNDAPTDLSKKTRRCDNSSDLPANTLLCSQCNAPFTNFEAFRRHLKTHLEGNDQVMSSLSGSQQLVCPECRLPLTSETALEVHLATHLGATCTEYGCQACLKLFQKPDELQKHLMDIHAHHLYRCALCKEMFDSKVSIQVHFAVKHSNECKVHKCTRCSLIFRTQSEFEAHVRSSHLRLPNGDGNGGSTIGNGNSSNGMYRCLLCTLSLSSEAELAAHVSTHQRQFQCSLCDDAFHIEFLLDKHMQSAHNSELNGNVPLPENLAKPRRSPFKKDLKCDICDADFSSESALLGHRKQAHNIKNNSGNNNNNNTKIAAAALSLFCAYCSEACKSRADLEIHMKSHQSSGGRHKCNICDELCPSAALLAQHKLSHIKVLSGSTCSVCREPLTTEHQLTSHQNEHHPAPLPQPCVVCRQTLVTDLEVNVHARFHSLQAAQAQATSVASSILSNSLQQTPVFTTATTVSHTNSESNSRSSTSPRLSPRLRCLECNVKLETPEEAEAHAQVHQSQQKQSSSVRTYQCIKCQESFASESEIEAHVASHLLHEGSIHECHLCRGTFDTPLRLQCHLIEHTFEGCGSFTCYMCSSVFTTAPRLQQHMVEHGLAARPYDCHHCHQKFFFRAELENHALSHPEATDGSCRECLASYPDLPRFHNRRPWPIMAIAEANTAATRISPARPTQDGSPHQAQQEGEEAPPSTNGHRSQEEDSLEEEELQP